MKKKKVAAKKQNQKKMPSKKVSASITAKKKPVVKTVKKTIAKSKPAPKVKPAKKTAEQPANVCHQILKELKSLQTAVNKNTQVVSPDAALEIGVDSIRRLLSELMEQRTESILGELVAIRYAIGDSDIEASARIDKLLTQLGAIKYSAQSMNYVDPLIHSVVAERDKPDLPDGVIVSTIRPGYRTGRGVILGKALVAVNRRS